MQKSSIKVGSYKVPVTPSLRESFAQMIEETSGLKPVEQMDRLFNMCMKQAQGSGKKKAANNVIELIHYLHTDQEVPIGKIIREARALNGDTLGVALELDLQHRADSSRRHAYKGNTLGERLRGKQPKDTYSYRIAPYN